MIDMYLYDDEEQSQVQFVGFVGEHSRYDLMLVQTDRHYGKTLVLNMQTNKFGII
ncbi:SAV0927 family protein, partial [Staphylococcus epidermidis]